MKKILHIAFIAAFLVGCAPKPAQTFNETQKMPLPKNTTASISQPVSSGQEAVATFAGGCFWCIENIFDNTDGVYSAMSGYTGGDSKNPTYEEVSTGTTKHREAVQILFDPMAITYTEMLEIFFRQIDPTDGGGQFADRGFQYTTAVYYHNEIQQRQAKNYIEKLNNSGKYDKSIVTVVEEAKEFYEAEEKHQNFAKKRSEYYEKYAEGSGRKPYIREQESKNYPPPGGGDVPSSRDRGSLKSTNTWEDFQKPSDSELKKILTELQYKVTQKDGTERPFSNAYDRNKEEGIYVDIVSGEPLFSSTHKFDSGTGWPSFYQPLEPENIVEKTDTKLFRSRTEIRSKNADSHLGHVFPDGPEPTGKRYCMNSAAMRFIPKADLVSEGYEEYISLFE